MKNLIFFIAIFLSYPLLADPIYLVTEDEVLRSNGNKSQFLPKLAPVPGAPNIDLVTPKLDGLVQSPTPIKLKFQAKPPSAIKPETFKIFYGSFQIDVTERLLGSVKVEPAGFNVDDVALPKGAHKLTLNIQDSDGRIGQRVYEFEVK
jgi:hypothetical protein